MGLKVVVVLVQPGADPLAGLAVEHAPLLDFNRATLGVVLEAGLQSPASGHGQHLDELLPGQDEHHVRRVLSGQVVRLGGVDNPRGVRVDVLSPDARAGDLPAACGRLGLAVVVPPVDADGPVVLPSGPAANVAGVLNAVRHEEITGMEVSQLPLHASAALGRLLLQTGMELPYRLDLFRFRHCENPFHIFVLSLGTVIE